MILSSRFGEDAERRARVQALTPQQLDEALRRAISAQVEDEIFAGP